MLQVRSDFKTADAIFTHYQEVQQRIKEREQQAMRRLADKRATELLEEQGRLKQEVVKKILLPVEEKKWVQQNVPTTKKELARVIIAGVASEHDRTVDDLMSDSRVMLTAHARQEAMLRVYEQFSRFPRDHKWGISMPWLGRLFRRDHSTVLHAVRVARVRREEIRS